jgi:hypothetical protein
MENSNNSTNTISLGETTNPEESIDSAMTAIEIISQVQTVALRTSLPIVLAVLKHLSERNEPENTSYEGTTSSENGSLTLSTLKTKIETDSDLKKANYVVSIDLVTKTIENLIIKNFVEVEDKIYEEGDNIELSDNDKIKLTQNGYHATTLLLLSNLK